MATKLEETEVVGGNGDAPRRDDPHKRTMAYAGLVGAYSALVAGLVVSARRTGRRPPQLRPADIALIGIATFKLSRVLSRGRVTTFLRAPFTRYERPGKAAEVLERPVGTGMQHALGELMSCPFCISQWIGTALTGGYVFAPGATRVVASGLAAITLSDALQYAHTALQSATD